MADTTFEEASRCPSCQDPGKPVSIQRPKDLPRGTKVNVFECENDRCERAGERWLVQTNPDGSIPQPGERNRGRAFSLPGATTMAAQAARDELAILDWLSTHPGSTYQQAVRALGG